MAPMGNTNASRKLSDRQIANVKWLTRYTNMPQREIAALFRVSVAHVSHIKNGQTHARILPNAEGLSDIL